MRKGTVSHQDQQEAQWMRSARFGNAQQHFVPFHSIHDHVLCLALSESKGMEYVTVLHVEGISYDLKSSEEQQILNDLYQAFLCALPYPIQILWRTLPLDLSTYLADFQQCADDGEGDIWSALATSHRDFLEQLASRRTLLDRHIYLVLRVGQATREVHPSRVHSWLPFGRQRGNHQETSLERARQELDGRVGEIIRFLSNMHITVRRLSGKEELLPFYYSCLTPKKAQHRPLVSEWIEGVDRPVQVRSLFPLGAHRPMRFAHERIFQHTDDTAIQTSALPPDFVRLADLISPTAIALSSDSLKIDHEFVRVIRIAQLPRLVTPGWLKPLAELDEPMEVSFHLTPLNSALIVHQFRRRQMEYQSSRLLAQRKGNTVDPTVKVAEADVDHLLDRVASGEERMLDICLVLAVRGVTKKELNERTERVLSVLYNLLLQARVMLFEQQRGFLACLPYAKHALGTGILLDSRSASTLFPFLSNTLFHPGGILEGITPQGDPVVLDAWSADMANANRIMLGPPGWGKSHQVKASIMRMALKYTLAGKGQAQKAFQIIVIDPEREYGRLAQALGGQVIRLSPGSPHHLNPFDLPATVSTDHTEGRREHGDRLADHVQKVHTLLEMMLADRSPDHAGKLTANEKGILDRAIYECYRKVGITSDQNTHDRPAPLMRDLYEVLDSSICGPDPTGLTQRLRRYVHGSLAGLFSAPTDIALENAVMVFDIHDMETEMRPIGLFLVSNFVWTQAFQSSIPRQLIVDEAATLYQYESGALFLEDLVRRARKHYLGVTIISQHPLIFQHSAIPANCATHILMRQDATSLDLMASMFKLSEREVHLLQHLGIGEALLTTSEKRLHVRFESSVLEHLLSTTDPRELAMLHQSTEDQQIDALIQRLLAVDHLETRLEEEVHLPSQQAHLSTWGKRERETSSREVILKHNEKRRGHAETRNDLQEVPHDR